MEHRVMERGNPDDGEVIASFGEATLVKVDGRMQLRGGSMADRLEALEWIALFLPEEVAMVQRK